MKIAIDAMGGDHAPDAIVKGAMKAIEAQKDLELTLIGNEAKIKPLLTSTERIHIIHTDEEISGEDEPIRAFRKKKNASMVLMAKEVKEGRAQACVSAGNTGALVVSGLFGVGRMKGIDRPALSPTLPTTDEKGFLLMDAGANVDATATNLLQYGVMGSIYCEKVRHIPNPRVAILNVGSEEGKGNNLTKKAYKLLKQAPINFIGNIEAREVLEGKADVVITDGFSGNILLKSIEGTAAHVIGLLKDILMGSLKTKLVAGLIKGDLKAMKDKLDYPEYGGACLFGLAAPVVKSHGSSNDVAIYHTILQAYDIVKNDVIQIIDETMQDIGQLEEE